MRQASGGGVTQRRMKLDLRPATDFNSKIEVKAFPQRCVVFSLVPVLTCHKRQIHSFQSETVCAKTEKSQFPLF